MGIRILSTTFVHISVARILKANLVSYTKTDNKVHELAPPTSWVQKVNSGMDTCSPMGLPEEVRRGAAALHLDTADMHGGARRRGPPASAEMLMDQALEEPQHSDSDASEGVPCESDDDEDSNEGAT